jgi:hypothetical protein
MTFPLGNPVNAVIELIKPITVKAVMLQSQGTSGTGEAILEFNPYSSQSIVATPGVNPVPRLVLVSSRTLYIPYEVRNVSSFYLLINTLYNISIFYEFED